MRGFFKGAASPMLCRAPLTAWFFTSHELIKPKLDALNFNGDLTNFMWGAWAGITLMPVLVPVELFKCKAQSCEDGSYKMIEDMKKILNKEGPKGFYRGALASALREVPGSGILFMVKNKIDRMLKVDQEEVYSLFLAKKVLAGGWAGMAAWCTCMPIDCIKSVIQTSIEHKTMREVSVELYRANGFTPFFRGMIPQAFRIFPASSSLLLTYEVLKNYLN